MSKTILFSPVGGTDPISNSNFHDGALLHICRVYHPDMIYMYMSKEMLQNEANDHRYTFCLNNLYLVAKKDLNYQFIERPELIDVHDFNFFYDEFKSEINKITKSMEPDDILYINISSGTPAMKSALLVLATLGDIDGHTIQVTTPDKKINTHDHKDYDVQTLWEIDPDNQEGFDNRCQETRCSSLALIKQEQIIKQFINSYDYSAALEVATTLNQAYTEDYIHYIEYANYRLKMDISSLTKLQNTYNVNLDLPVKNSKYRSTFEYALALMIKDKKGYHEDFVRGLTPLILEIYILIIQKDLKINPREMCFKDPITNGFRWSKKKLLENVATQKWIDIWNNSYSKKFDYNSYIKSDHLLYIIQEYCQNQDVINHAETLRKVENNARNTAAHEISMVTAESVQKMAGYSCSEIITSIKALLNYVNHDNNPDEIWNSYELMNKKIIDQINYASKE